MPGAHISITLKAKRPPKIPISQSTEDMRDSAFYRTLVLTLFGSICFIAACAIIAGRIASLPVAHPGVAVVLLAVALGLGCWAVNAYLAYRHHRAFAIRQKRVNPQPA